MKKRFSKEEWLLYQAELKRAAKTCRVINHAINNHIRTRIIMSRKDLDREVGSVQKSIIHY